jgi:hypothetical protein
MLDESVAPPPDSRGVIRPDSELVTGCTGHYLKKDRKSLEGSTVLLGPKPRTYSMGTLITLIRDPLGMIQSFVKRDFRL